MDTTSYAPQAVREMSCSVRALTSRVASAANWSLCQALTPTMATPVTAMLVTASATTLVPMPQPAGVAQVGRGVFVQRMSVPRESAVRELLLVSRQCAVAPYAGRGIVIGDTCWCRYTDKRSAAQVRPVLGVRPQVLGDRSCRVTGE